MHGYQKSHGQIQRTISLGRKFPVVWIDRAVGILRLVPHHAQVHGVTDGTCEAFRHAVVALGLQRRAVGEFLHRFTVTVRGMFRDVKATHPNLIGTSGVPRTGAQVTLSPVYKRIMEAIITRASCCCINIKHAL